MPDSGTTTVYVPVARPTVHRVPVSVHLRPEVTSAPGAVARAGHALNGDVHCTPDMLGERWAPSDVEIVGQVRQ